MTDREMAHATLTIQCAVETPGLGVYLIRGSDALSVRNAADGHGVTLVFTKRGIVTLDRSDRLFTCMKGGAA